MRRNELPSFHVVPAVIAPDFLKRQTCFQYLALGDMTDCGWRLQLNQFIAFIRNHQGKSIRFGEIEGLKQEIDSLCSLVERQANKFGSIKHIVS